MATSFMTAAQVGSYFVTQYYSMLQQQPELVHQFYSDASTMLRIDGHTGEAATAMLQIHALVMSLQFTSIEIQTAHSLESWSGGVVVMVTGSVQMRDFSCKKKFAQTFFLAPQEKGFFVLNDIFHFIEDEQMHTYPASLMGQSNLNSKLTATSLVPDPVPNYMMNGVHARDYVPLCDVSSDIKENGTADNNYSMPEHQVQQAPELKSNLEGNSREQANGFHESTINPTQVPPPIEESVEEPQKHTYASILRATKVQSALSAAPVSSSNKTVPPVSGWTQVSQPSTEQSCFQQTQQYSLTQASIDNSSMAELGEEASTEDDRGEIKSVYVRNLSPTVSPSEIEEEFMKFGQLTAEGVAIRRLKDTDVCYAFVEFEDIASVQNAIKTATVQIGGRQVYIEERRANSSFARGRRGRGRSSYQPDASRGRFGGRSYNRGASEGEDHEFNRAGRSNGYYRQTYRHDRGSSAYQTSRNEQSILE